MEAFLQLKFLPAIWLEFVLSLQKVADPGLNTHHPEWWSTWPPCGFWMYWELYGLIPTLGFLYLLYTEKDFGTETWTKLAVADPTGFCSVDKLESGGGHLRVPGTWMHRQIHPLRKGLKRRACPVGRLLRRDCIMFREYPGTRKWLLWNGRPGF